MTTTYSNYGQILNRNIIEIFENEMKYIDLKEYNINLNNTSLLEVLIENYYCFHTNTGEDYYCNKNAYCNKNNMNIIIKINNIIKLNRLYPVTYTGKMILILTQLSTMQTKTYDTYEDTDEDE